MPSCGGYQQGQDNPHSCATLFSVTYTKIAAKPPDGCVGKEQSDTETFRLGCDGLFAELLVNILAQPGSAVGDGEFQFGIGSYNFV